MLGVFYIKIGLLGLGTVGRGVYEIINNEKGSLFKNNAGTVQIVKILVHDLSKDRGTGLDYSLLTSNPDDILLNNDIDLVVAVMGGSEPEYGYVLKALNNKKHVVTANKQIISEHMDILLKTARENNVSILFEGSVGGGIPIIDTMQQLLKINKINRITGILNGTTNFILSQMSQNGSSFNDVLALAQKLGFAEADPTADIMGFDVSRKISILSSLAYNHIIKDDEIYKRGITGIEACDIDMIKNNGYVIKYVAQSVLSGDKYYISVEPALIKADTELATVNNEFNVIILDGNIIGEIRISGKGAGRNPTANAVVGDIIYIMENKAPIENNFESPVVSNGIDIFRGRYYFRVKINNNKQFRAAFDCIDKYVRKKDVLFEDENLYFFTEEITEPTALKIENEIKNICDELFFARIIE
ncbi:MAG: homoserine dehydrogenase [Eubacteriaceae bacterium]